MSAVTHGATPLAATHASSTTCAHTTVELVMAYMCLRTRNDGVGDGVRVPACVVSVHA